MFCQQKKQQGIYLGPYLVIAKIEEGSQSNILLARNREKFYGLKVYKNGYKGRYSFKNETEMLGHLDNDLIIKPIEIYDFLPQHNTNQGFQPFLVMDYFENGDLRHFINAGNIPTKIMNTMIRNMAQCLLVTQMKGIIHRDIKPQNFLVDSNKNLKLIDFGIAIKSGEEKSQIVGTTAYIAPQIHSSRKYSHKSDIFALGVIVFQLAIGVPNCFPFKQAKITDSNFLLFKQKMFERFWAKFYSSNIQAELKRIIQKMLSSNPEQRPSAQDILNMYYFKNEASLEELTTYFQSSKPLSKIPCDETCITF